MHAWFVQAHYNILCSVINVMFQTDDQFLQQDRSVSYAFVCPFDFVPDYCLGSIDFIARL